MSDMSVMQCLDPSGHSTTRWNRTEPSEVENAREVFDAMIAKGYKAFRVKGGEPGERMKHFDPTAEKMILVPAVVGG